MSKSKHSSKHSSKHGSKHSVKASEPVKITPQTTKLETSSSNSDPMIISNGSPTSQSSAEKQLSDRAKKLPSVPVHKKIIEEKRKSDEAKVSGEFSRNNSPERVAETPKTAEQIRAEKKAALRAKFGQLNKETDALTQQLQEIRTTNAQREAYIGQLREQSAQYAQNIAENNAILDKNYQKLGENAIKLHQLTKQQIAPVQERNREMRQNFEQRYGSGNITITK